MQNLTLTYNGTYEGLLSAIFEVYRLKIKVDRIVPAADYLESLFAKPIYVSTNLEWAERVKKGIQ